MASVVQLNRVWATGPQSPNRDPGATKWALGWVAEIPTLQVLNYINNRNDTNQLALAERGVFEWVGGIAYKLGALSWDELDSKIYRAKVANPSTTLAPSLNLAQWEPSSIQISRGAYDAAAANWAAHIANKFNPHGLTAHQLGSYTTVEIDAKVAVVKAVIDAHVSITAGNPHGTTAADVNAVPVTGGTYTGVVNHRYSQTLIGPTAYAGSLNATTAGITIGKGATARVGLDASSKPVWVDESGVSHTLMTEAAYLARRTAQAGLFSAPLADLALAAKNGAILTTGSGVATFTGAAGRAYTGKDGQAYTSTLNVPRLTTSGMAFTVAQDKLIMDVANNIKGFAKWSIYLDFRASTGNQDYITIPQTGGNFRLYTSASVLYLDYYLAGVLNTSIVLPNPTPSSDHKIVLTFDGTNVIAYFDGLATTTLSVATMSAFIASANGIQLGFGGTAGATMYVREFKTWNIALTPRQVTQV